MSTYFSTVPYNCRALLSEAGYRKLRARGMTDDEIKDAVLFMQDNESRGRARAE